MLNWLMRVLGLGPAGTPGGTTSIRPFEPTMPATPVHDAPAPFAHAPADPAPVEFAPVDLAPADHAPFDHAPAEPDIFDHAPVDPHVSPPVTPEPLPPEPLAEPRLQYAAFTIGTSAAGSRVFARPEDGRLAQETGNPDPGGWEVHGFVTDRHPGILFVLATEGPTAISGERTAAHAFRIEEAGDDAFALFDLATEGYLCSPQFVPGVNPLENDRGVVNAWEMFHLIAAENVAMPDTLPPLLPPAGEPITAAGLQAWRSAPRAD